MLVRVTQEHIDNGRADPNGEGKVCPVALAVADDCRSWGSVSVREDRIMVGVMRHKTPQTVRSFIKAWDDKKPVKPFWFHLKKGELDLFEHERTFGRNFQIVHRPEFEKKASDFQ